MNTQTNILQIVAKLTHLGCFRAEYATDGYISITKKSDDSYEIDIQQVSFFDQATHTFYHFNNQELVTYLENHIKQLGKIM